MAVRDVYLSRADVGALQYLEEVIAELEKRIVALEKPKAKGVEAEGKEETKSAESNAGSVRVRHSS